MSSDHSIVDCPIFNDRFRSVHNIRIERLWVEVGRIIVAKWKPFFESLEDYYGLRLDSAAHLWLLHHLFLDQLNHDIQGWAEHWNSHVMRLKGQKNRAPRDMFLIGLRKRLAVDDVVREEDGVEDVGQFGIDWDSLEDEELIRELRERGENPFDDYAPDHMNEVPCEAPDCPLTGLQVEELDNILQEELDRDMDEVAVRRAIWICGLSWCRDLFNQELL